MKITTSIRKMTLFSSILVTVSVSMSSCKADKGSSSKSFVGLQAVNPECKGNGAADACSFLLLQQWFNGQIPVDPAAAQAGKINWQVHQKFSDYTYQNMPPAYRDGLMKYYLQQIDRVRRFQLARTSAELTTLLNLEAAEMYDILRTLIEVGYKPRTTDALAVLISQPNLRDFFDRYSVDLLWRLYRRPLRDLLGGLDRERDNFANLMIKTYLTPSGTATQKFQDELAADCSKLLNFIGALGASTSTPNCIPASPSNKSTLGLSSGPNNIAAAAAGLTGGGQKFASAYASIVSADGPVKAGEYPKLSIFGSKDVNAGAPACGSNPAVPGATPAPGGTTPIPTVAPAVDPIPGSDNGNLASALPPVVVTTLNQLLGPTWASGLPSSANSSASNTNFELNSSQATSTLPRSPRFDCLKAKDYRGQPLAGLSLINCNRYWATLPDASSLVSKTNRATNRNSSSGTTNGNSFGLAGGYNFFLIAKYSTPIQNQGQEGACTAFGITHTIEMNMQCFVQGFTSDARKEQWDLQNAAYKETSQYQSAAYVGLAIQVAQKRDFRGHKIVSDKSLKTLDEIKAVMNEGRAVYSASEVDESWTTMYSPGTALSCGRYGKDTPGHAYSLQGYDDEKEWFIVKNSWGTNWGEFGYGYLPYSCIEKFQTGDFHDLKIQ